VALLVAGLAVAAGCAPSAAPRYAEFHDPIGLGGTINTTLDGASPVSVKRSGTAIVPLFSPFRLAEVGNLTFEVGTEPEWELIHRVPDEGSVNAAFPERLRISQIRWRVVLADEQVVLSADYALAQEVFLDQVSCTLAGCRYAIERPSDTRRLFRLAISREQWQPVPPWWPAPLSSLNWVVELSFHVDAAPGEDASILQESRPVAIFDLITGNARLSIEGSSLPRGN